MSIKNYLSPLLKYWWLIAAAALVATVSSFFVTSRQPLIYQSTATLIVGRAIFEANPSSNDLWLGQQLASYYADIGMRSEVYGATMKALGLPRLPQYSINPLPNSQLLEIVVNDSNPARAQAVANELANQLIKSSPTSYENQGERQTFLDEQITYVEGKIRDTLADIDKAEKQLSEMNSARQIADAQNQITALQEKLAQLQTNYAGLIANTKQGASNTLTIIEPASLPNKPVGPQRIIIILMAAAVAAVVAAAAAYLLEYLDDTLKSPEDVSNLLKLPVLANIPLVSNSEFPREAEKPYIYASSIPRSAVAEEFRLLRVNLEFAGIDKELKKVFVTSSDPSEGKSSVASNLAAVIAQGGKKVVLVDTDFRKPSINEYFAISNERGLSDVFRENLDIWQIVQQYQDSNLWIIPTGITPPNPIDLLSSNKMTQILEELGKFYDMVVIDGPPVILPDALVLSLKVDGVLMVVTHSATRRDHAIARLKQLQQARARVLGVIINKVPHKQTSYYHRGYYYHDSGKEGAVDSEPKQAGWNPSKAAASVFSRLVSGGKNGK
jgi:non-specific protein-tyrosine kinase